MGNRWSRNRKPKGKVVPEKDWIRTIVKACWATKTPIFLKDNLKKVWGEDLIQEWPEGMPMDKGNDVPHCKECEHCINNPGRQARRTARMRARRQAHNRKVRKNQPAMVPEAEGGSAEMNRAQCTKCPGTDQNIGRFLGRQRQEWKTHQRFFI
jgi:hypothetical protein